MLLSDSVSSIKNIGEKRLLLFNKLNIFTVQDLIEYYPRDYEDRSKIKKINELIIGENNAFIGKINNPAENLVINGAKITKLILADETDTLEIFYFGRPFLKNVFLKNQIYIFFGKVNDKFGRIKMENPDYELMSDKELINMGRIVPIYKSTFGLSQKFLRSIIKSVLDEIEDEYSDFLPNYLREKYSLKNKKSAVKNIHFPESDNDFFEARKRLVFEELFLMQASLLKLRNYIKNRLKGIKFENTDLSELISLMPFELTGAQNKVLDEIIYDFKSEFLMNRLVQGDVGSGKTAIALLASYCAIKNSYQACLMAPTEVLAVQHYNYFKIYFEKLGIKTELLIGSQKKKEKKGIYKKIENGECNMLIGTHAVIQENVKFENLGLVITDEQHRFGVNQRKILSMKGENPHILIMTATPIPRTLGLILYGDLDISIIDEMPPGRQYIDTFFVNSKYLSRIYNFIRKEAEKGKQVYIICASIEETENSSLKSVINYTEILTKELYPLKIRYLHGKMSQDEKNEIMESFLQNKFSVLVSTTVIEVGINIKNATLIVIENAERFGLSQLHQLRGRVGRDIDKSYCILVSDTKNKYSQERLQALVNTNDGFEISELDLKLRGPGEFFGLRQHGIQEFKIANIYKDMDILKSVNESMDLDFSQMTETEKELLDKKLNQILNYDSNSIFL